MKEIPQAGHMSPFTHRDAVNGLLAQLIDRWAEAEPERLQQHG